MKYLDLTSVPMELPPPQDVHPIQEVADSLPEDSCMELYWEKREGRLCCVLGVSDGLALHAALVLKRRGCGISRLEEHPLPPAGALLYRRTVSCPVVVPGEAPVQRIIPQPLEPEGSDTLFYLLDRLPDGCGLGFFVRRSPGLPLPCTMHLAGVGAGRNKTVDELLTRVDHFQAVGCTYGPGAASLAVEACAAWPGLTWEQEDCPCEAGALFERAASISGAIPPVRPLRWTVTRSELEGLTRLTRSQGAYGLPVSKDTLCGAPVPLPAPSGQTLTLGRTQAGQPVTMPLEDFRTSVALTGASGSGKGNLIFGAIPQLIRAGVSVLAVESAKEELPHLSKLLPEVKVWRPEEGQLVLNPFSLPEGVTVAQYRSALLQTIRSAFQLDGPLESLFSDTLNRAFVRHGFRDTDTLASPGVTPFGLGEFIEAYTDLMNGTDYSAQTGSDIRTAGVVRLMRLLSISPIFDSVNNIPMEEFTSGFSLLELAGLTSRKDKQLVGTLFLLRLATWLRLTWKHSDKLRLVIVLDEAHNLLRGGEEENDFLQEFSTLMLELRSCGVGFLIADQGELPQTIYEAAQTRIFMGSSGQNGLPNHAQEMRMPQEAVTRLHLQNPGEGFYWKTTLPTPVFFRTPNLIDRFELGRACPCPNSYLEQNPRLCIETYQHCVGCPQRGRCRLEDKIAARTLGDRLLMQYCGLFGKILHQKPKNEEEKQEKQKLYGMARKDLLEAAGRQAENLQVLQCALFRFASVFNRTAREKLELKQMVIKKEGE